MKRRRRSYKSKKLLSKDFIETAVVGAVGFVAAGLVGRVLPSLSENPATDSYIRAGAKIVAGSLTAMQKGSMATAAGVGMATSGAVDVANALGLTDTVNNLLTPPDPVLAAGLPRRGIRGVNRARMGCPPQGDPRQMYAAVSS